MGVGRTAPRLSADSRRSGRSDWTSLAAAVVAIVVLGLVRPDTLTAVSTVAIVYLSAWSFRCLLYAGVTWWTFRSADGDTLAKWLAEGRIARRKRMAMERLTMSTGPSGAATFCVLALGVVVYYASEPDLRSHPVVAALAAFTAATSWLLILMVYTVHYARENVNRGGLQFVAPPRTAPQRSATTSTSPCRSPPRSPLPM